MLAHHLNKQALSGVSGTHSPLTTKGGKQLHTGVVGGGGGQTTDDVTVHLQTRAQHEDRQAKGHQHPHQLKPYCVGGRGGGKCRLASLPTHVIIPSLSSSRMLWYIATAATAIF